MKYAFLASILMAVIFMARPAAALNNENYRSAHSLQTSPHREYDYSRLMLETNIGDAYFLGQGVPQNYAKAFQYYKHAASQGFASAQNKLGIMYQHALSVPQSYAKAAKWYLLAAEQGDSGAENNLGLLYERGQGMSKDTVNAYEWFDLSAINARSAPIIQNLAKQHMQEVASHMTADQIAQAQAKALAWLKGHDRPQSNSH